MTMEWTRYQAFMVLLLVLSGSFNNLLTSWADGLEAQGVKRIHTYNHVFVETEVMFIGELLCLIAYLVRQGYRRWRSHPRPDQSEEPPTFNPLIFLPATLMDMCSTICLYIGLKMTFSYSFQLLRASKIIFTLLFSIMFLHQKLKKYMWAGIVVIVVGLVVIGVTEGVTHMDSTPTHNWVIAGILFVIAAEFLTATQFVYEHYFVTTRNISPLAAVGWEGLFGTTILGLLLILFYYIKGTGFFFTNPQNRVEDIWDAFEQMRNNYRIIIAMLGFIVCVAFYNVSGLTLSKQRDATTRVVIVTLRIIIIWPFIVAFGWQKFRPLEIIGLLIQLVGICIYCNVIFSHIINKYLNRRSPNLCLTQSQSSTCSETSTLLPADNQVTLQSDKPQSNTQPVMRL